jgi:hypothetical protein
LTLTEPPGAYFFRVRSGSSRGLSVVSNEATAVVTAAPNVPGPPVGLSAGVAGTRVTLIWQRPVTGGEVTEWIIELNPTSGLGGIRVFRVPASVLSASGDLAQGEYTVRVRGLNAAGPGPPSNEPRFTVDLPIGGECDVADPPVLLPATIVGRTVSLAWLGPRTGAPANFVLLVGSTPGSSDLGVFNVGSVNTFVAQANPGTYHVRVVASNTCGPSVASNGIAVVVGEIGPPPPPSNVRVTVAGNNVTLAWDAAPGAASYLIEAGTVAGSSNAGVLAVAGTSLTVPGVPSGVYYGRVRAVGTSGASAPSAEVVIVVP